MAYKFTKLSERHKLFCKEYVECLDATERYLRSFKTKNYKVANATGYKLRNYHVIDDEIQRLIKIKEDEEKTYRDKIKDKKVKVLDFLLKQLDNKLINTNTKIKAADLFLKYTEKVNHFDEKDNEQILENNITNIFEINKVLLEEEDLEIYENIKIKE